MNIFKQILTKYTSVSLMLRIFIGLVVGATLGLLLPQWTGIAILGRMFVSALKGIAPVLVAVLVMSSIAKAGSGLGPRFRTVISRYLLSTFIAALCAVAGSMLFPVTLELGEVADVEPEAGSLAEVFTNLLTNMVGIGLVLNVVRNRSITHVSEYGTQIYQMPKQSDEKKKEKAKKFGFGMVSRAIKLNKPKGPETQE